LAQADAVAIAAKDAERGPWVGPRMDPEDRLLWKQAIRRLVAEEIHDAMLAASGQLDPRMGARLRRQPGTDGPSRRGSSAMLPMRS
jgi:hypothetical protein